MELYLIMKKIIFTIIYLLLSFCICFFLTFDITVPAFKFDAEGVVLGPRPLYYLCKPSYDNFFYSGNEWPFKLYHPICKIWIIAAGYEQPISKLSI